MKETKTLFKSKISALLSKQGTDEVLSEAALPAYAHKNPLIDLIFWKRLETASDFITKNSSDAADILDFGCGTGVFSYHMGKKGHRVFAIDLDLTPVSLLKPVIDYSDTISFHEGDFFTMDFNGRTFDFIVALDVLEHIPLEDLPTFLDKFASLLKPNGSIVVSGPTENKLYRLGRKLAGSDFTGAYHETTIAKIKAVFERQFTVKTLAKLIWPIVLFDIFYARKK